MKREHAHDHATSLCCNARFAQRYPILTGGLIALTIKLEGGDYVGKASDGMIVQFGPRGAEDQVEEYLRIHPTPEDW